MPQRFSDIAPEAPSPRTNDIFQLSTNGSQTWPDGLNYFTDNGAPAGQTFTTRSNAMNLVSVAVKTAGLNSGNGYGTPASTPTYYLRIYSMSGNPTTMALFHPHRRSAENQLEIFPSDSNGGRVTRRKPRSQWTSTHSWSRRLRSLCGLILCSSVSE